MGEVVIKVNNISKLYRIGKIQRATSFRELLGEAIYTPFRRLKQIFLNKPYHNQVTNEQQEMGDVIWALKDVSFEVKRGEVVGIIGRNGAGKSTLLKILSRITEPTEGYAEIRGRVGSLLEVGTGFHPELTGRENIYLNGRILGMTKREIDRKFDEIVAFSEIGKFIDTPVKYYSSGMYVRLAFAVAAHLEQEILIVDEVLAVGDAAFQRKCLGKMRNVSKEGRTVLFVSHNMAAILNLCSRCILLEAGRIALEGETSKVVEEYLNRATPALTYINLNNVQRDGSGMIRFKHFEVTNDMGEPWLYPNRPAIFKMTLETKAPGISSSSVRIAIGVRSSLGEYVLELQTSFDKYYQNNIFTFPEITTITCTTKQFPLRPGTYYLTLYVDYQGEVCDRIRDAVAVEVRESDYFGTGATLSATQGYYILEQRWEREI